MYSMMVIVLSSMILSRRLVNYAANPAAVSTLFLSSNGGAAKDNTADDVFVSYIIILMIPRII
jgi:hypothetical protein